MRPMWMGWAALLLLALGQASAWAAASDRARQMDAVEVAGLQPGPSLWRVSHGDHEMWILGTLNPVPKRMQWDASDVESIIRESQQVLLGPAINVRSDIGFFAQLALVPKLFAIRKNPGKETLSEVLPADIHARWKVLSKQYFRSTRSLEKRRPIFVAQELYKEALDDAGLRDNDGIIDRTTKIAKKAKVTVESPRVIVMVEDMKGLLAEFEDTTLDDVACLDKTMTHVENDLPAMRRRASAWAVGDIDVLRQMQFTDSYDTCLRSLFSAPGLEKYGFVNLRERAREAWLTAAEAALKSHRSTFAVLPMGQLLREDGYAAELRKRGYLVEAPGEESPEAAIEETAVP
ncbi:MAG TPA: TraB/GumN family protein [Patescibacteria group bacterium]|nr:TraB/GumN family protein [Patescibacteria group bacterium]